MKSATRGATFVYRHTPSPAGQDAGQSGSTGPDSAGQPAPTAGLASGRTDAPQMADSSTTRSQADSVGAGYSSARSAAGSQRSNRPTTPGAPSSSSSAGGARSRPETTRRRDASRSHSRPAGDEPDRRHPTPASALDDLPPRTDASPSNETHAVGGATEAGTDGIDGGSRGVDRRRGVDAPIDEAMRFDADVDRVVERLYRKLERKQRIERERRGL
ncbi:hypothetical protein [Halovivax asiaticus]|nr:hypothetical protein [Halovivax asiaticus]